MWGNGGIMSAALAFIRAGGASVQSEMIHTQSAPTLLYPLLQRPDLLRLDHSKDQVLLVVVISPNRMPDRLGLGFVQVSIG